VAVGDVDDAFGDCSTLTSSTQLATSGSAAQPGEASRSPAGIIERIEILGIVREIIGTALVSARTWRNRQNSRRKTLGISPTWEIRESDALQKDVDCRNCLPTIVFSIC